MDTNHGPGHIPGLDLEWRGWSIISSYMVEKHEPSPDRKICMILYELDQGLKNYVMEVTHLLGRVCCGAD